MSLELCILASGSAGNSTIVRSPRGTLLIDMGIGPRTAARRLAGTGVGIPDIRAICLTHLDRDHCNPSWLNTLLKQGIRIFCHASRVESLLDCLCGRPVDAADGGRRRDLAALVHPFDGQPFEPLPGLCIRSIPFAHDQTGSHGFVVDGFGSRIGYATDLGRVPPELFELFVDLDLLALESNYDRQMQLASSRPWFLKQRIMGGSGHLSNEQAFEAVRGILSRCERRGLCLPSRVILLHRSRECNCPNLLRTLFSQDARTAVRVTLAEQHERTEWFAAQRGGPLAGEQLPLAFG